MSFNFSVPTIADPFPISVAAGESLIFVGANGGGKTRLAVNIEEQLGISAHRVSAHRALKLNPSVPKISESLAMKGLKTGYSNKDASAAHRTGHRWGREAATKLLNDYDFLVQALFAEQSRTALVTHQNSRAGQAHVATPTKFERLKDVWERLLPHRQLHISGDDIEVSIPGNIDRYSASDLSDGERAIFYMLGQALAAEPASLLLIDEPELHVHPSILSKLWDEIEGLRPDCAFVFITHDLAFASGRNAQKYVLKSYSPATNWNLEALPEDAGFDEELTTLILGSRSPILFVEGDDTSLDKAIYRACYPDWTVVGRGSSEEVFHSVVTLRNHDVLTRISCTGLIDADDHTQEERDYLNGLGINTLDVSEIENLILLPSVSRQIAMSEGRRGPELEECLNGLADAVFQTLETPESIEKVVVRYCLRRIDRRLKKVDLRNSSSVDEVKTEFETQMTALDIEALAAEITARLNTAIQARNLPDLLSIYDNKGLVALAARHLKNTNLQNFRAWLSRVLRNDTCPEITEALRAQIPEIPLP